MRSNAASRLGFPRSLFPLLLWVGCTSTSGGEDAGPGDNQPPVVTVAATTFVASGTPYVLAAVASDPEGDALTYAWEQRTGDTVSLTGGASPELHFTTPAIKTQLTFRLTVTDAKGAATQATATVEVRRNTPTTPLPLEPRRVFTYTLREQDYAWNGPRGPLSPDAPVAAGQLVITVGSPSDLNGLQVWPLTLAESGIAEGMACTAGGAATACASPNRSCGTAGHCEPNKPLSSTVQVVQLDQQLLRFIDDATAPEIIIDPLRPAPAMGMPFVFEGYELITAQDRRSPKTVRYFGTLALDVPGTPPMEAMVMDGDMAAMVETVDGAFRSDVLGPYRTSRTWWKPGTGVVFFQWEDVPTGYASEMVQVGYRDLVLTGISPPLP